MAEPLPPAERRATWLRRLGAVPAALLFPGLGQVVNAEWGKAVAVFLAFGGTFAGTLVEAGALVAGLGDEAVGLAAMERLSDPQASAQVVQAFGPGRLLPLLGWMTALLAVIAYSVWDAWRGAARGRS